MIIISIDPGPTKSAYVVLEHARPVPKVVAHGITENGKLPGLLFDYWHCGAQRLVLEMIASYGLPVGAEVFETCVWIGRFIQHWERLSTTPERPTHARLLRKTIVTNICNNPRAKDANVRQALIDRYGGPAAIKKGGALYGIANDQWSALAVGCTWLDLWNTGQEPKE